MDRGVPEKEEDFLPRYHPDHIVLSTKRKSRRLRDKQRNSFRVNQLPLPVQNRINLSAVRLVAKRAPFISLSAFCEKFSVGRAKSWGGTAAAATLLIEFTMPAADGNGDTGNKIQ